MKKSLAIATTVLALGGLVASTSPALAEGADVTIKPAKLKRGADVRGPHLEGKTVVDGATRIKVRGASVTLLGKSGKAYVVVVGSKDAQSFTTKRVTTESTRKLVRGPLPGTIELSDDGSTLAFQKAANNRRTKLETRSASTGEVTGHHTYSGYVSVLDVSKKKVLLGGDTFGTAIWYPASNSTDLVTTAAGYAGNLAANRLAVYDGDPYDGGCSRVSKLSTGRQLWRSCDERVQAFSPNGTRMVTIDKLADGLGPSTAWARQADGALISRYTVNGYFGVLRWESNRALLLEAYGKQKSAVVRCDGGVCRRASDLRNPPAI